MKRSPIKLRKWFSNDMGVWIPAFAGMTKKGGNDKVRERRAIAFGMTILRMVCQGPIIDLTL